MGSRNSKSNDDNEKVASNQEPINNSNKNNLDESMNSLDNSIENTSIYKGLTYDKRQSKQINEIKSDNYNSDQLTQEKSNSDTNSSLYMNIIWNESGNDISIIGTFCGWKKKYRMKKTRKNFFEREIPIPNLNKEKCEFKFIVDDKWRCSKNYPQREDEQGNLNNYIDEAYINDHLNNLRNKNNETMSSTNNETNEKREINKSNNDISKDTIKSSYGNSFPSEDQLNQEAPNMPDVLAISTSLSEHTHQRHMGKKKYLKYSPVNLCSSYKNIFQPGHSYMNHIFMNKNNIKFIKDAEKVSNQNANYFQINCNVKIKSKCLSILYFSPIDKSYLSID